MNDLRGTMWPNMPHSFPDANFPLAPESVRDTYAKYWGALALKSDDLTNFEHNLTLENTIMSDFCDSYLPAESYTALMLGPISDNYTAKGVDNTLAERALINYRNHQGEKRESSDYVFGLLSDRDIIRNFRINNIFKQYSNNPELLHLLLSKSHLPVPEQTWQTTSFLTHPKDILNLVNNVNIESLLARSAHTLMQLTPSVAMPNSLTLQNMYFGKSLLAPLNEVLGLDGLAMGISSNIDILQSTYAGESTALNLAKKTIAERGEVKDIVNDVQNLFSTLFGQHTHELVIKHTAPHGIIIGEGKISEQNLRVNWRLKSLGRLTKKIQDSTDIDPLPLDIIGATIILDDEQQVANYLKQLLDNIHDNLNVRLTATSSRTDAVHIRGDDDYIKSMQYRLGFNSVDNMKRFIDIKPVDEDDYQVCKITLIFLQTGRPDLRAEVQLITKKDRESARISKSAHFLMRGALKDDQPVDTDHLKEIHSRKNNINPNHLNLNPASMQRSKSVFKDIL